MAEDQSGTLPDITPTTAPTTSEAVELEVMDGEERTKGSQQAHTIHHEHSTYATPSEELPQPNVLRPVPIIQHNAPSDTSSASSVVTGEKTPSHYASARASIDTRATTGGNICPPSSALLNLPPPPPLDIVVNNLTVGVPKHSRIAA